jgi:hypothetical protein
MAPFKKKISPSLTNTLIPTPRADLLIFARVEDAGFDGSGDRAEEFEEAGELGMGSGW